jgi:hypothetical protein
MASNQIKCPNCKKSFEMTAAIEGNLRADIEAEFQKVAEADQEALAEQRKDLESKAKELATQRTGIEKEVAKRLEANRKILVSEAKEAAGAELSSLREEMEAQAEKLTAAQKNEVDLRKQQRELEREKNEFQLKLTREIDAQRQKIVEETSTRVADEYAQKELEHAKQRADLMKQLDEMKRKADVASQQAQGEVVELQIESILKEAFPHDAISEVLKGVKGADLIQTVQTRAGAHCGSIVWEIKQTRSWSDSWPEKLKGDQRAAKADIAVIVTAALPKGVERIGVVDGVWVTDQKSMLGLALALRSSLIEVARARTAQAGRKEKSEEVFDYVVGSEFRGRVQALVETMISMKEDLDAEKRVFEKVWSKREKSIVRVLSETAGIYGGLSGIVGTSLPEIKQLALEQLGQLI